MNIYYYPVVLSILFVGGGVFAKPFTEEITIEEVDQNQNDNSTILVWLKVFEHYSNHSSHCHFRNHPEIHLAPGKSTTIQGDCMLITCIDPDMNSMSASWCPSIFPNQDCKMKRGDKSKPYPFCCPSLEC